MDSNVKQKRKQGNPCLLVGNLGNDPDVKFTASGVPVARFSLATTERFKDDSGKFQERTEWHSIVAWQKLAEIIGEFLSKGSKVYVEGKLQSSSWEDRQSREKKYRTEVVAKDLVLLGSREKGSGVQAPRSGQVEKPESSGLTGTGAADTSDDEVPF